MLTFVINSSSWKKRVEEVVPGKHDRDHHRRDDRDSHRRQYKRRGEWRNLQLMAFFGVMKASAQHRRRGRRGVRLTDDMDGATDEEDGDDDDDLD